MNAPPRDHFLGDWIVTYTSYTSFFATGAGRELLIAAVLPEAASIARAHIAKCAGLVGSRRTGATTLSVTSGSRRGVVVVVVVGLARPLGGLKTRERR